MLKSDPVPWQARVYIDGFRWSPSRHPEVGALRNLLTHHGITAPHTGEPFSEAFLFGVGGGVGFGYFLFERRGAHPIHLGTRIHTRETERPEFFGTITQRIGVQARVQNSSSASAAASNMRRALEAEPLLVWTDAARLPYTGLSGFGSFYHAVVVYGIDDGDGSVTLADRPETPFTVGAQEFRYSRETSWSPKYRTLAVSRAEVDADPRQAAEAGIRDCIRQMTDGLGVTNFGLNGIRKWGNLLTSTKEKKSWIKVFPAGAGLFGAIFSIFEQIQTRSGGGAAARILYAEFLEEAAGLLGRPALGEAARLFRESEQAWSEVAGAHLPPAVPLFAEARDLALERKRVFEEQGAAGRERLDAIRTRLTEIERQASASFPLPESDTRAFLSDLRQRILALAQKESEAVEALKAAMD